MHGIVWPALPDASDAGVTAVCAALEQTQWLTPAELAERQRAQLAVLLAHAADSVPHYRGLDPRALANAPVLTRAAITAAGAALRSTRYPATHGRPTELTTSRTSGEPVRVAATAVTAAMWRAITRRDHAWHRRDLHAHLAVIGYVASGKPPDPYVVRRRGWGPATAPLAPDAPLSSLSIATTTDDQIAWLARTQPTYLLVYPSVLDAIVRRVAATGAAAVLASIRELRTNSELLTADTRALCRDVLGVPVVDLYSCTEVGYVALQCPDHAGYHVQAEHVVVEILRADGTPCAVGETGRVVITDLHNFATPIIRYELGDYSEVGAPCACGRGLPVLTRIVGRRRGMLVERDGATRWPLFAIACRQAARYRELQIVQGANLALHVRVVPDGDAPVDRAALIAAVRGALGPFEIDVELVDALARSPAGKLEEFVSHVIS